MEFNIDLNNVSKHLYFCKAGTDGSFDAANDVVCYPMNRFLGFSNLDNTDGTTLTMCFSPLQGPLELASNAYPADVADKITLTIEANKAKEVISEIINKMNALIFRDNGIIVIADDMDQEYISSYISSVSITLPVSYTHLTLPTIYSV